MNDRAKRLTDTAINDLVVSLNSGHSETLKRYLATMAKFHRYSWHNALLIWQQKPEASHVAGFRKWLQLGRCVKGGERGIMILVPVGPSNATAQNLALGLEEPERKGQMFFNAGWVFDISQTEGKDLATIGRREGDPGTYSQRLFEFAHDQRIEVREVADLGGASGRSRGGEIEILQSLPPAEKFGVLVHEVAHELLHQGENSGQKPRNVRELEAEAIAFVVCEAIGLEDRSAGVDYIHLYQGDAKLLMASLSSIQKGSNWILKEILV